MSAIHLLNAASSMAEFRLFQGINQIARVGVPAGGHAAIPTTTQYTAQAFTSEGEFSLSSNVVTFDSTSIVLLAQMQMENGFYDFQLAEKPGIAAYAITLENTWSAPVQFKLNQPHSLFQIVTVVDAHNCSNVSTAKVWSCYAICNGITSAAVTITDPNARVTARGNNDDAGITLSVS